LEGWSLKRVEELNKMKRTIKKNIGWTSFFVVWGLFCSVFALSASAQTDSEKPLKPGSLTALVTELKEVVKNNEPDEKKAARVAKLWDERRNLAGKTRSQVINLLWGDLKTVITDSGKQYQIGSIFNFYKRIPDNSPSVEKQSSKKVSSKPAAVKKLLELTVPAHPSVGMELLPGDRETEPKDSQLLIETFDETLAENKELTPPEKSFVKANYDKLEKIVNKQVSEAAKAAFPLEQWLSESLEQDYNAKFTDKELTGLITFFQSPAGKRVLKCYKLTLLSEAAVKNGGAPLLTKAEEAAGDKFAATPLGEKFITTFLIDSGTYSKAKMEEAYKNGGNKENSVYAIMDQANLNKIFNRFVKENYKK
jgi:hypothetical protein